MALFAALAVLWYVFGEVCIYLLRRPNKFPSHLGFWIGIMQSVGAAIFGLCAVLSAFFS